MKNGTQLSALVPKIAPSIDSLINRYGDGSISLVQIDLTDAHINQLRLQKKTFTTKHAYTQYHVTCKQVLNQNWVKIQMMMQWKSNYKMVILSTFYLRNLQLNRFSVRHAAIHHFSCHISLHVLLIRNVIKF